MIESSIVGVNRESGLEVSTHAACAFQFAEGCVVTLAPSDSVDKALEIAGLR